MKNSFSNLQFRNIIRLQKNKKGFNSSNSDNKKENQIPSLSDFLDINSKNFFIRKNKNILHDYEEYLKVKEERKNGIFFSPIKKLSYEERKKNETFNLYNKSPFKDNPRLIISNYKVLKENNITDNNNNKVKKNKILGVDEGLITLPKFDKDTKYVELFHGVNLSERFSDNLNDKLKENLSNDKLMTLNNSKTIPNNNKHNYILSSLKLKKRKNPMLLERGEEFLSYFGTLKNLKNKGNNLLNKNNLKEKDSLELIKQKYIEKLGKQKEKYENELNYNYEIKCLDNWDFEHITKHKDLKTDNEFKQFLDEVDNSQMKWLVEIKNDKEQLRLMRRNKYLFDFLIQIDKEQQAIAMQSINISKKGFNFDIFNKKNDINLNKEKFKDNVNDKNENMENSYMMNNEDLSKINSNISQVEFYRQVMKEKIKVEDMFHGELRAVAEECYIANLNRKKAVINLFNISQEFNALIKKEEETKDYYNKKFMILQLKSKKKKKNLDSNNNAQNYLSKYNELRYSLFKKDNNNIINNNNFINNNMNRRNTNKSLERRGSDISKDKNFQQQSEFLAMKNEIEIELNSKLREINKQKKKLNSEYNNLNKEIKYCQNIHKKSKSKLEQRIKTLTMYYYQILKKGVDVRNTGLTWAIVKLLELGAFLDKHHFPTFLNDEQICYLMKIGTKTYELSELIKLFQILKRKQKKLREKHINDNIEKEKQEQIEKFNKIKEHNKNRKFHIGNDYMEYIEEIQRKYENVINVCLNENKEESNITKISNDLKQYILHDRSDNEENLNRIPKGQKLELLFIPGSLSEYFAQDKRFRQYFDDVFYLNEEINKRQEALTDEKQSYLNHFRNNFLRSAFFSSGENNKYKQKKTEENEIVYAALFGNGISI